MESSIAEAVLLPWWKIVIYIVSLVLAVITIKVTVTFNLNDWLRGRKEAKEPLNKLLDCPRPRLS